MDNSQQTTMGALQDRNNGESFLDKLREGASELGDCGHDTGEKPHWLDKEKLLRVKGIYEEHCPGILLGHFMGQVLLSQVPSLVQPLLHTANHSTLPKATKRAAMTLRYVIGWYKGRIWDPQDAAHKSAISVRTMHKSAFKSMSAEKPMNNKEGVWFSQFDMALTQFAFLGPLLLYPDQLGLYCTQDQLECLVHLWRYIGYLLGMKDQYNLGSLSYENLLTTCHQIVKEICVPTFSNPTEEFIEIGMMGTEGYANFSHFLEYNAMHNFGCQLMGIDNMWKKLSLRGYLCTGFVWLAPKLLGYQYLRKLTVPNYSQALDMKIESVINGNSQKTVVSTSLTNENAL